MRAYPKSKTTNRLSWLAGFLLGSAIFMAGRLAWNGAASWWLPVLVFVSAIATGAYFHWAACDIYESDRS